MGGLAMCGCNSSANDIIGFWKSIELRKISFDSYQKLFEVNQRKWISSGENKRDVDLRKCDGLYTLLDSADFSDKQRIVYFNKLNEFVNEQTDKLTFFTSLAFFTRISKDQEVKALTKTSEQGLNILDNERGGKEANVSDHLYNNLIKMAIKRTDHDDVTRFFIEFVTEFPLEFVYVEKKVREEKEQVYSQGNRDKLFTQIKMMNNAKFYAYMFNKENVMLIHNDLLKIQVEEKNVVNVNGTTRNGTTVTK